MAKSTRPAVVQTPRAPKRSPADFIRLGVAVVVSFGAHAMLFMLFLLVAPVVPASSQVEINDSPRPEDQMIADAQESLPREIFDSIEVDPSGANRGGDITNPDADRTDTFSLPGDLDPRENIGRRDGNDSNPPVSFPLPPGMRDGPGGSNFDGIGGAPSGPGGGAATGHTPFDIRTKKGNSAVTNAMSGAPGTGSAATEAAVARGLRWLARNQSTDGRWMLDGSFPDKGTANDTAGTGLGLLPFLGAGKAHKLLKEQKAADNPYDKVVNRGLKFLMGRQDKRGDLGGGMYGHAIATIALSEAYGLTQDPNLRIPAQRAVNFIVQAQHEQGGWRYSPGQEGDMSVTGWQIMALKSAQMASLDVPSITLKKAGAFLDSMASSSEGYGYNDKNPGATTTAVGLLCRQFVQGWGPQNLRLITGIRNHIKPVPPAAQKDAYYHYYATQVMYHFGGEPWKEWNVKMREHLVKTQDDGQGPLAGSWTATGDRWGAAGGGRLMVTSLNLLTLEVYYRYLPLYYRDKA